LVRKTPLRKPNRGDGIVSKKPRPKSAYDFLGLFYCFNVQLYGCVVPLPYMIYIVLMARYSLFVLKVLLNNNKPNQTSVSLPVFSSLFEVDPVTASAEPHHVLASCTCTSACSLKPCNQLA